jgi:outer membrane beta-barrel protein
VTVATIVASVVPAFAEPGAPPEPDAPSMPDSAAHEPAAESVPDSLGPAPGAAAPAPVVANPQQVVTKRVRLDRSAHNVVRSGPGERFAVVGVFPKGATFPVVAMSGDWYNVRVSDTETGWVHASLCKELDDLGDLTFRPNPKLYVRTGSFILTGYAGAYSYDRKSNSLVLGGRLGYYIFDRVQAEGGVAWTHVRRPAEIVETLFGISLEAEDFHSVFYHLNLTYELLPGRQMVPFVTGGVGSTIMLGRTEPSWNYGAGTTLYLSKRMATRWEFRAYQFDSGPEGARVTNNNIEFAFGTSVLF